MYFVGLQWNC